MIVLAYGGRCWVVGARANILRDTCSVSLTAPRCALRSSETCLGSATRFMVPRMSHPHLEV